MSSPSKCLFPPDTVDAAAAAAAAEQEGAAPADICLCTATVETQSPAPPTAKVGDNNSRWAEIGSIDGQRLGREFVRGLAWVLQKSISLPLLLLLLQLELLLLPLLLTMMAAVCTAVPAAVLLESYTTQML